MSTVLHNRQSDGPLQTLSALDRLGPVTRRSTQRSPTSRNKLTSIASAIEQAGAGARVRKAGMKRKKHTMMDEEQRLQKSFGMVLNSFI